MRVYIILLALLLMDLLCKAQDQEKNAQDNLQENVMHVSDSLMRKELAIFRLHHTVDTKVFTEIPLKKCDSQEVLFSKGNTFIHLYFKKDSGSIAESKVRILDSMFVVLHSHYWVKVPRSTYQGVINSNLCDVQAGKGQTKISSPYYKAFQSKDKARLYICLMQGKENDNHEVIWIFQDGKFWTRT